LHELLPFSVCKRADFLNQQRVGKQQTTSRIPGLRRSCVQPAAAADRGEDLLEFCGRQRRVDAHLKAVAHVRRVEPSSGNNATIASTENEPLRAALQVQRRTHRRATGLPPCAELRVTE
jgi:hypothetical protein